MDWYRIESWKAYERPRVRGDRQQVRRLRAPRARHRGHARGRALPDLRVERRPRAVHGLRAGVLEELLRVRRPARAVREAGRARSTPTTRAATASSSASCARSSATKSSRRVDRARRREELPDRAGEHAEDDRGRSAVPGPLPVVPARRSTAPTCCPSRSSSSARSCPSPTQAPTVGEHTDAVLPRRARLRRRAHRALREKGALG